MTIARQIGSIAWCAALALGGGVLAPTVRAAEPLEPPVAASAPPAVAPAAAAGAQLSAQSVVAQVTEVFEVERVPGVGGMVERRLVPADDLVEGDELRYLIRLRNTGASRIEAGRIQVQTPVPEGVRFLPGSAGGAGAQVEYAVDGATFSPYVPEDAEPPSEPAARSAVEPPSAPPAAGEPTAAVSGPVAPALTIRWTYQQTLEPGATAELFFHVRLL